MTTLDDVLQKQKTESILQAPTTTSSSAAGTADFVAATDSTLSVSLVNNTSSSTVYAYITGLAIDNNNSVYLLQSDGKTAYYPSSPSTDGTSLAENVSIALGAPGTTLTVTIPRTAGGRIWFSRDATLSFYLNPGPGLVEPSVTNTADNNYNTFWDFCEFTFNSSQLYINITYVDFVSLPIGMSLTNTSGTTTTVEGLPSNGLDTVCSALKSQTASDSSNWSDLIVTTSSGANLRALSPNSGITMNSSYFSTYFDSYVDQVWSKYTGANLTVNTQASWGDVTGTVSNDVLSFGSSVGSFSQPSSADIFSCSSGPFATTTSEMGAIGARLAAAFNRSTLLIDTNQPEGEVVSNYYTNPITNHYSRILHATYLDGKGYAFPYDDVAPTGGADQSGSLYDPNPATLTITVGGPSSSSSTVRRGDAVRQGQQVGGRKQAQHQRVRRDLGWVAVENGGEENRSTVDDSDLNPHLRVTGNDSDGAGEDNSEVDLEKGLGRGKQMQAFDIFDGDHDYDHLDEKVSLGLGWHATKGSTIMGGAGGATKLDKKLTSSSPLMARSLKTLVPRAWADKITSSLEQRLEALSSSPAKPLVDTVVRLVAMVMSLSVRALISRVTMALFLVLFYLVLPLLNTAGTTGRDTGSVGVLADPAAVRVLVEDGGLNITSGLISQSDSAVMRAQA